MHLSISSPNALRMLQSWNPVLLTLRFLDMVKFTIPNSEAALDHLTGGTRNERTLIHTHAYI
jgi:hypothetical protein